MSVIVKQFQTVRFIQMMSLTFGLFTQVSGSGPLGPLVLNYCSLRSQLNELMKLSECQRSRPFFDLGQRSLRFQS